MTLNLPGKKLAALALSVVALSSCAELDPHYVAVTDKRTRMPQTGSAGPDGSGKPASPVVQVPVDTFLASGAVPTRLKAGPSIELTFRSNIEGAAFECQSGSDSGFSSCPDGDRYRFEELVHGRGYQLKVRARSPEGRYDQSPLILSFIVDNLNGLPVTEHNGGEYPSSAQPPVLLPVSPSELPMPIPSSGGIGHSPSRRLQIGSDLALTVPDEFLVTSYATTKTYNSTLHLMRVMGADTGTSLFPDEPCNRDFERIVAGPMGYSYCDATPTRAEWDHGYAARIPRNHLEIVRSHEGVADEKFFAAAFDAEGDPAEQATGIHGLCRGAVTSGQTRGPLAQGFFGGEIVQGIIHWCQVRDRNGRWWWLGSADLDTTNVSDGAGGQVRIRAKLIYTLAHQSAVYSGQRFATRFSERSVSLLSKIAQ